MRPKHSRADGQAEPGPTSSSQHANANDEILVTAAETTLVERQSDSPDLEQEDKELTPQQNNVENNVIVAKAGQALESEAARSSTNASTSSINDILLEVSNDMVEPPKLEDGRSGDLDHEEAPDTVIEHEMLFQEIKDMFEIPSKSKESPIGEAHDVSSDQASSFGIDSEDSDCCSNSIPDNEGVLIPPPIKHSNSSHSLDGPRNDSTPYAENVLVSPLIERSRTSHPPDGHDNASTGRNEDTIALPTSNELPTSPHCLDPKVGVAEAISTHEPKRTPETPGITSPQPRLTIDVAKLEYRSPQHLDVQGHSRITTPPGLAADLRTRTIQHEQCMKVLEKIQINQPPGLDASPHVRKHQLDRCMKVLKEPIELECQNQVDLSLQISLERQKLRHGGPHPPPETCASWKQKNPMRQVKSEEHFPIRDSRFEEEHPEHAEINMTCADRGHECTGTGGWQLTSSLQVVPIAQHAEGTEITQNKCMSKPMQSMVPTSLFGDFGQVGTELELGVAPNHKPRHHRELCKASGVYNRSSPLVSGHLEKQSESIFEGRVRQAYTEAAGYKKILEEKEIEHISTKKVAEHALNENLDLRRRLGRVTTESIHHLNQLRDVQMACEESGLPDKFQKEDLIQKLRNEVKRQAEAAQDAREELAIAKAEHGAVLRRKAMDFELLREHTTRRENRAGRMLHQCDEYAQRYLHFVKQALDPMSAESQKMIMEILNTAHNEVDQWQERCDEQEISICGVEQQLSIAKHQLHEAQEDIEALKQERNEQSIELEGAGAKIAELEMKISGMQDQSQLNANLWGATCERLEQDKRALGAKLDGLMQSNFLDHFQAWYAEKNRIIRQLQTRNKAQDNELDELRKKLLLRELFVGDGQLETFPYEPIDVEVWRHRALRAEAACGELQPNPLLQ